MMTIISAPHAVLAKKAEKIEKIDKPIISLIQEMKVTLNNTHDPEGVGLAAPQVGKSLQLFLMKPSKNSPIKVCINPEIIGFEDRKTTRAKKKTKNDDVILEGCLSLPNVWGEVKRHNKVTLVYLDEKGTKIQEIFDGFPANIVQHEYDHLQGILFPKLVLEQKAQLYKTVKNEKNETIFEEIRL